MPRLVLKNPAAALWLACGAFFFACLARMVLSPFFVLLAYRRDAMQGWDDVDSFRSAAGDGALVVQTGGAPNWLPDFIAYLPFNFVFGDDAHTATLATAFLLAVVGALGWIWFARMFVGGNFYGGHIAPAAVLLILGGLFLFSPTHSPNTILPSFEDYPPFHRSAALLILPYHHGGAFALLPYLLCWFWRCAVLNKAGRGAIFAGVALAALAIVSDASLLAWFVAPAALAVYWHARRRRRMIRPALVMAACLLAAAAALYAGRNFYHSENIASIIFWPIHWMEMARYMFVDSIPGGPAHRLEEDFPLDVLIRDMQAWARLSPFSLMLWGAGLLTLIACAFRAPRPKQRWAAKACLLAVVVSGVTGALFPLKFDPRYMPPFLFIPFFALCAAPAAMLKFGERFNKTPAQKNYLKNWTAGLAAAVLAAAFAVAPGGEYLKQAAAARYPPAAACFDENVRRYGLQNGISSWVGTSLQFASEVEGLRMWGAYGDAFVPYKRHDRHLLRGGKIINFIVTPPRFYASADILAGAPPRALFYCEQVGVVRVYPPFPYLPRLCALAAEAEAETPDIVPTAKSPIQICRDFLPEMMMPQRE